MTHTRHTRRHLLQLSALGGLIANGLVSPLAFAQANYPHKPIQVVVPFPAGGIVDNVFRAMSPSLQVRGLRRVPSPMATRC